MSILKFVDWLNFFHGSKMLFVSPSISLPFWQLCLLTACFDASIFFVFCFFLYKCCYNILIRRKGRSEEEGTELCVLNEIKNSIMECSWGE